MYNFSVPAALKAWIDQVTFPRMSLPGTRFVVVCARGGTYLPGTPRAPVEHAVTYLRDFVDGHFAVTDVDVVAVELVNARVVPALAARRAGRYAARPAAAAASHRLVAASAAAVACAGHPGARPRGEQAGDRLDVVARRGPGRDRVGAEHPAHEGADPAVAERAVHRAVRRDHLAARAGDGRGRAGQH